MADDLVFHAHPTRGRIVRWMLEEVGQPYRVEPFMDGAVPSRDPDARASVPAIRHGSLVVTGNPAICAYLADAFPAAGLAPARDDELRGAFHRWLFFAAEPAEVAACGTTLGIDIAQGLERMAGYRTFTGMLDGLEAVISWGDYLLGERFTAADLFVGAQLGFGMKFGMIEPRPVFEDYWTRLSRRPAYRRAVEREEASSPAAPPPT